MITNANLILIAPLRRLRMPALAAALFAMGCIVPVGPQADASAQAVSVAKRAAARAAAKQAATRQASRSAATRGAGTCRALDNKCNGIRREAAAQRILAERYPNARVQPETLLRNRNGTKARDPITGKGRRIDFVLFSRGTAVKRFEVTSQRANKKAQVAREQRILGQRRNGQRRTGPVYVRDRKTGKLVPVDKRPSEIMRLK